MPPNFLISFFLCLCVLNGISKASVIDLEETFDTEGYLSNETQVLLTSTSISLSSSDDTKLPESTEASEVIDITITTDTPTTVQAEVTSKSTLQQISAEVITRPRWPDPLRRFVPKHRIEPPPPKKYPPSSTLFDMCPALQSTCPGCSVPQNQLSHYICQFPVVLKVLILSPPQTDSSGRMCGKLGKLSVHGTTKSKQFRSLLRYSIKDTCECQLKVSQHYFLLTKISEFTKQGRVYGKVSMSNQSLLVSVDQYMEPDIIKVLANCSPEQNVENFPNTQEPQQPLYIDSSYKPLYIPPDFQPVLHDPSLQHVPSSDSQRVIPRSARVPLGPNPLPASYQPTSQQNLFSPPLSLPSPVQYTFARVDFPPYSTLPPIPSLTPFLPYPSPNVPPPALYVPPLVYNQVQVGVHKSIISSATSQGHQVNVQYHSAPGPTPVEQSGIISQPLPTGDSSEPVPFVSQGQTFLEHSSATAQVPYIPNNIAPTNIPSIQMMPSYPPRYFPNSAAQYVNSSSSFSSSFSSTTSGQPQYSYIAPLTDCLPFPPTCPGCFSYNATIFREAYCNSKYAFLSTITFPDHPSRKSASENEYGTKTCLNVRAQLLHDVSINVGQNLYQSVSLYLPTNCKCFPDLQNPAVIFLLGFDDQQPIQIETQFNKHHNLFLLPAPSDTTLPDCSSYQTPTAQEDVKSAEFGLPHVQYASQNYPTSSPSFVQYPTSVPSPVQEYSSVLPPYATENYLVSLHEPTQYSDIQNPQQEYAVHQESTSSEITYETMKQPTAAPPQNIVSNPTSEILAQANYEENKQIASETLQITSDALNFPTSPANYDTEEMPVQTIINPTPESSTFETYENSAQTQQQSYEVGNNPAPIQQPTYDAATYPVPPLQQPYEAAHHPSPPQQQPYAAASYPMQQQPYQAENYQLPPQQQPETANYASPPQQQLSEPANYPSLPQQQQPYETANYPSPPQQQPYEVPNFQAPQTNIQDYEARVCPPNVVQSCPVLYPRFDVSHVPRYCASPFAIIVELQDSGVQRPYYTFPRISIKTTSSSEEKNVVVSISGYPPLSCSQRSLKVIKNLGTLQYGYQEGSKITIVLVSNCNFNFHGKNKVKWLLLYSSTIPSYLPNGGIQITENVNVVPLEPNKLLPDCVSRPIYPIYISPPDYPQPPLQYPYRKHEYPLSSTPLANLPDRPLVYTQSPSYQNTPPSTLYRPSVYTQYPYYPESKVLVYTPPPIYKNTIYTPPPPPLVNRPIVYTPSPSENKPPSYTPPPLYKKPYIPPMLINKPAVYTSPPEYKTQVYTPPPPPPSPYVHQKRPTQPPTYVLPASYNYLTSEKSSLTTCPKLEQPFTCPMYQQALPVNFHQLYCVSQFVMVVAMGVDKDGRYITDRERPRVLPFLKPKRSTLEYKYNESLKLYNLTVTRGKTTERKINQDAYAFSRVPPICHNEHVLGLYDISPERTAHEYLVNLDIFVPILCDFAGFDNSPAYVILMSLRPPDLTGPIILSEEFAFFPLPEGKLVLPTCNLPNYPSLTYEEAPFQVTQYVPPQLYGQRMEVSSTNGTCGTCGFLKHENAFNVPCDIQFAAVVEILETSAELNIASSLDILHHQGAENYIGTVLHVKSKVSEKPPTYEYNPPTDYPDFVKCRYAKVRVVKDLSPYSTYPTKGKEFTLVIPANCDCHLFDVDSGFALLLTKFPVLSNPVVPITGNFSKVLCLPSESVAITKCPTMPYANWIYNIPTPENPTNRQLSYSFSYAQTPEPYVNIPSQYTPFPVKYATTPLQYTSPPVSNTPMPYVPVPVSYQPAPTPSTYSLTTATITKAPFPYTPTHVRYTPAPYAPTAAPYKPAPDRKPYRSEPVPYAPAPVPYSPAPVPHAPTTVSYKPVSDPKPYAPTADPYKPVPDPKPYAPAPVPSAPEPVPYAKAPVPYKPASIPYTPASYTPTAAPYKPAPDRKPYVPKPIPYVPTPAPYAPAPAPIPATYATAPAPKPYTSTPEPYRPKPVSYEPPAPLQVSVQEPHAYSPQVSYFPSPTPYKNVVPDQYSTLQAQYVTGVPYTNARVLYTPSSEAYPLPKEPDVFKSTSERYLDPYAEKSQEASANAEYAIKPISYIPDKTNFPIGFTRVSPVPIHPPKCTDYKTVTLRGCPVCEEIRCIKPEIYCKSKLAIIAKPHGVFKDEANQLSGNIISLYEISAYKPSQRAVSKIHYKLPKQCHCPMLEENSFVVVLMEEEMTLMTPDLVQLDEGDYVYSTFSGKITLPSCSSDRPRTGNLPEEIILPPVLDSELPDFPQPSLCPDLDHSCPKCESVDDDELKNLVCSTDNAILVSGGDVSLNGLANWKQKDRVTITQYIAQNYSVDIEIKPYKYENRCILPEQPGDCNSISTRFHYDATEEVCYAFDYSGCNGNANNFKTEEECEETCMKNDNCEKGSLNIKKVVRSDSKGQYRIFQYVLPEHCDCPQLTTGDIGFLVYNTSSSEVKTPIQLNQKYHLILLSDAQRKIEINCDEGSNGTNYDETHSYTTIDTEKSVSELTSEVTLSTTTKKSRWLFG